MSFSCRLRSLVNFWFSSLLPSALVAALVVVHVSRTGLAVQDKKCTTPLVTCGSQECNDAGEECSGEEYDCALFNTIYHEKCYTELGETCDEVQRQCAQIQYFANAAPCENGNCVNRGGPPDCIQNVTETGCETGGGGGA